MNIHGATRSTLIAIGMSVTLFLMNASPSLATERPTPVPHDTTLQQAGEAGIQGASGGGCRDTLAIRSCISFRSGTTNPVLGDFYLKYWDDGFQARLWILVNGSFQYKYHVLLDHPGHYPIAQHTVSGTGSAYTHVEVYNASGIYLYSADSLIQRW